MSYDQSDNYNTTQGSDTSAQRGRETDPLDEYSSTQRRDPSGNLSGQQVRDPALESGTGRQGTDPTFGGQEGVDTYGYAQTRRGAGVGAGAGDEGYGYGQSGTEGQYDQSQTGQKPSMMDKIKGTAEKMTGKMTHDPERVQAGHERKEGRFDSGGGY